MLTVGGYTGAATASCELWLRVKFVAVLCLGKVAPRNCLAAHQQRSVCANTVIAERVISIFGPRFLE